MRGWFCLGWGLGRGCRRHRRRQCPLRRPDRPGRLHLGCEERVSERVVLFGVGVGEGVSVSSSSAVSSSSV